MRARDNPYRAERLHALAFRLTGTTWESLWGRLRRLGGRACVVGPKGSGKTTLLQDFAVFLRARGMEARLWTIREDASEEDLAPPRAARPGEVWIVDGADRLNPLRWMRWTSNARRAAGLIATSHHRPLLRPTLYRCQATPALLRGLMAELHPGGGCGQPSAAELFSRHRGNLREAFRELYDYHAAISPGSGHGPDGPGTRPPGVDGLRGRAREFCEEAGPA